MRTIREINEQELDTFITISANAYPGLDMFTQADRRRFRDRILKVAENPNFHLYALFEDGQMLGVMRLYDFTMNFLNTRTLVGGVGGVAVDLLHKKEKVASDLLQYFLQYYHQKGACLTALYPFRPDFYKRMGFGYGTKMNSYRVSPDSLTKGALKRHVVFLTAKDKAALAACYDRYLERSHGVMQRGNDLWEAFLGNPTMQTIGVKKDGHLGGYLVYKFEKGRQENFLSNKIVVQEMIFENPGVLQELLTFLHSQADQIEQIVINIQDDNFHHLLNDPRYESKKMIPGIIAHESNMQGVGIMYRVIDLPRLFDVLSQHNFSGVSCRLKIELTDSFMTKNDGVWMVDFTEGQAKIVEGHRFDVAIQLDISEFSSMIMGAVGFANLAEYGLAAISDSSFTPLVDRIFSAPNPICLTQF